MTDPHEQGRRAGWDQGLDAAITTARRAGADHQVLAALHQLATTPAVDPPTEPAPDLLTAAAARVRPPDLLDALAGDEAGWSCEECGIELPRRPATHCGVCGEAVTD